jgi:hypothetical protein
MRFKQSRLICGASLLAMVSFFSMAVAHAAIEEKGTFFPFVIPWDDAQAGVATDVSYLNAKPAGVNGRIVVKNGHFVEEKTGKRIRFLGTNFTFAYNFPDHDDAIKIAAHLAKLGINIVRIHHHDADYGLLWDKSKPGNQTINPDSRERLDFLIAELKKNGIYVDLNLHVSRKFTAADGFPESVSKITLQYDKRVDHYNRRMIELQKQFAKDYLAHVNPYTKIAYVDDPCVAMVEINNENSLVDHAADRFSAELDDLPEPFRGELVALWNTWLRKKYSSETAMRAAWINGTTPIGPSLLTNNNKWTLERQNLQVTLTPGTEPNTVTSGAAPPMRVTIDAVDGTSWHVQTHLAGLDLKEGNSYTVRFRAKADRPRKLHVNAGLDQADWHHIGLDADAELTPEWKNFAFTFTAAQIVPQHSRIAFILGDKTGTVDISDFSLSPGVDVAAATPQGSLVDGKVDMPKAGTEAVRRDWLRFLAETERAYADEMLTYLRETLKVKAPIIDSQISWGDSTGLYREANMDFADNHAYWNHPSFPGKSWDSKNWVVPNKPMVRELATGNGGTLLRLAEFRVAGKPYTITEYNEPAPVDFQAETVPEIAAFAAAQDWDGIFLFDWGGYGKKAANERIQGFFSTGSNPSKTAFLPAAALLFREGQIAPLTSAMTVNLSEADALRGLTMTKHWRDSVKASPQARLGARSAVYYQPGNKASKKPESISLSPKSASTLQLGAEDGGRFVVSAESGGAVTGFIGGASPVKLGQASIQVDKFGNSFCAITLTPLPNKKSHLLTIVGKVENRNMIWNESRTSVSDQWGQAPSMAEFVPATITLPASERTKVWALDGTGKRTKMIPGTFASGLLTFHTDPAAQTVWYEIAAP